MVTDPVDTAALLDWVDYQPMLVTTDFVVVARTDWNQLVSDLGAAAGWVAKMYPPPGDEDA